MINSNTTSSAVTSRHGSLSELRNEYYIWLANRSKQLTTEDLSDDVSQTLYDDVVRRGKAILTMSVKNPDREWVAFKFEIARALLGPEAASWTDNRLWLILGALEADLMAAVERLESIAEDKAWEEMNSARKQNS